MIIPIKTLQPVRIKAYATYGLIVLNGLFFIWELTLTQGQLARAWYEWSLVPCEIMRNFTLDMVMDFVRSMFYHGSWTHLIGNMTVLWIFGRNVEEYFGSRRFLALYFITGLLASITQILTHATSCIPMIGASGAIAGILGAYLLLYPGSRVKLIVIFFRFFPRYYNIPALVVLGLWFLLQLFNGVTALGVENLSGVAFFAHIGGFIAGAIITFIYLMFNKPPDRTVYLE